MRQIVNSLNAISIPGLAPLLFVMLAATSCVLPAQEMRVGQRLIITEEQPFEVQFVDGGKTTLDHNRILLFFERAPNNYICYVEGQPTLIPTSSAVPADEAVDFRKERCQKNPSAEKYLSLAYAYVWNDSTRSSLQAIEDGLKLDKKNVELRLLKCRVLQMLKLDDDASYLLEEILELDLQEARLKARALDLQAMTSMKNNEFHEAAELYEEVIELMPYSSRIYCNCGLCFYNMDDHDAALAHYNKAKKLEPISSTPSAFKSYLTELISAEERGTLLREAVELNPRDAQSLTYLHYEAKSGDDQEETQRLALQLALASGAAGLHRSNTCWTLLTSDEVSIEDADTADQINDLLYESIHDEDEFMRSVELNRIAIDLARGNETEARAAFEKLDSDEFGDFEEEYEWLRESLDN